MCKSANKIVNQFILTLTTSFFTNSIVASLFAATSTGFTIDAQDAEHTFDNYQSFDDLVDYMYYDGNENYIANVVRF